MNLRFTLLSVLSLLTISLSGQNSPYQIREAIMTSIENLDVPVEPIHHVRDLELDAGDRTVHVRIYRPSDRMDLPILYQIHGGGFIAGNLVRTITSAGCSPTEPIQLL